MTYSMRSSMLLSCVKKTSAPSIGTQSPPGFSHASPPGFAYGCAATPGTAPGTPGFPHGGGPPTNPGTHAPSQPHEEEFG
eukprot:6408970-Amphidinium_carterae.1